MHKPQLGEPRDLSLDINQTISHLSIENPGFGYSMPVEVQLIGGYFDSSELQNHVVNNLGAIDYNFVPAEVEVATINEEGAF